MQITSKMAVKTQQRKKQLNKHSKKYTSIKKKVSRRTRKNDLVLRGGGDDVEIYYKINFFNKIIASTSPTDSLKNIDYKKLSKMPEIKINKNGRYLIKFFYKNYKDPETQKIYASPTLGTGSLFAEHKLERTGKLTHTVKTLSINTNLLTTYQKLLKEYADLRSLVALTITIQIFNLNLNKNKVETQSTTPNLTYYFNLLPIT